MSEDFPDPFAPIKAASIPRRKLSDAPHTTSGNPAA
jgi:hypothetical protein